MADARTDADPIEDLIALYALNALDADDRAMVERRLATDARARAVLDEMRETVGALHASAGTPEPPARVKARLLARVDADLASRGLPARQESTWERIKRVLLPLSLAVTAASLVLAIGLGAWAGSLQGQLAQMSAQFAQTQGQLAEVQGQLAQAQPELAQARQQLAQVQRDLADTQGRLTAAQGELVQTEQQLAQAREELAQAQAQIAQARQEMALLQLPGLQFVSLPLAENAPDRAQFNFFKSPNNATALLTVSGLQSLPADQTYQFWLLRDGQSVPAGTFNVDADGAGRLVVQSSEPIGAFDQAGITIEPAGGSATPNLEALVSLGSIQ